jgi:hypothetical protein
MPLEVEQRESEGEARRVKLKLIASGTEEYQIGEGWEGWSG